MARAYSMDLRERAVRAALAGDLTRVEVAERFGISEGTLYGWLRRQKEEGSLEPLPHGGGREPRLDSEGMRRLKEIVTEANDRTLAEYRERVEQEMGVTLSISAVDRALKKLDLPRKKRR